MAIPPVRSVGDSGHIQDHNDMNEELAARLPLSGGTLTGAISGTSATFSGNVTAADPTSDTHLATKSYVDTNSGGIEGLSKIAIFSATITPSVVLPWYGAVFPAGSIAANEGWNDLYNFTGAGVTLPAGVFTETPFMGVGTPGRNTNKVEVMPLSATTIYVNYSNFEGRSGTNVGITIGPGPYTSVTSDTVKFMVVSP